MDFTGVVLITLLKLCFLCSCDAINETWTLSNFSKSTGTVFVTRPSVEYSLGSDCLRSIDCQVNVRYGVCINLQCWCPNEKPLYNTKTRTCVERYSIGSYCVNDLQCQTQVQDSICKNYRCTCPDKKPVYDSKQKSCLTGTVFMTTPSVEYSLGSDCLRSIDCQVNVRYGVCINFQCRCPNGKPLYDTNSRTCVERYSIGTYCVSDFQCQTQVQDSMCKNYRCTCPDKKPVYDSKQKSCLTDYSIGNYCIYSHQCQRKVLYSICKNFSCTCPDTKPVYDSKQKSCLTGYAIGHHCFYNFECLEYVKHSICKNSHCTCPERKPIYDSEQKSCLPKSSFGKFCIYDFTCQEEVWNSICQNFNCVCPAATPFYDKVSKSCNANIKLPSRSFLPWTIILTVCVCISLVMGIIVFLTIRRRHKTIANRSREVRLSIVSRLSRENATDRNALPSYDDAVHNFDTLPSYPEAVRLVVITKNHEKDKYLHEKDVSNEADDLGIGSHR